MNHTYPLTAIDFYKAGHRQQYPARTELVVSNFTPRSGKHGNVAEKGHIVFFGLQYFIKDFLIETWNKGFFSLPKDKVVGWYKRRMDTSLGLDSIPVDHVEALHDLGFLPIEIKALPEGTLTPIGTPCMTIHNTRPEFFWLTNYLETVLSAYLWLPCTSATTARGYRKLLDQYAEKTGTAKEFVGWQGHDFSFRGMSSIQSAMLSGAGHLLFFTGTDTVPAIDFMERYYGADANKEMVGGSIAATEHSVMCMGGEESEIETFRRLITEVYPKGLVSIVSDTWDFWKVLGEYAVELKDTIVSREGKLVFRPDSGNPADILCGIDIHDLTGKVTSIAEARDWAIEILMDRVHAETPHGECGESNPTGYFKYAGDVYKCSTEVEWNRYDKQFYYTDGHSSGVFELVQLSATQKGAVEALWDTFGGTITGTGHKLLDSHVGLIYGDSITYDVAKDILTRLEKKGFASGNVVFGIGSFTYQYVTRDTWGWAVKATYGVVNGQPRNIYKCPKTDDGGKKSAKGLLVVNQDGTFTQEASWEQFNSEQNALKTVFKDGRLIIDQTLTDIRARTA